MEWKLLENVFHSSFTRSRKAWNLKPWFVLFCSANVINFPGDNEDNCETLDFSAIYINFILLWPFSNNTTLHFTRDSAFIDNDTEDQVEAKGTGVILLIRTGNQIVTYTTIETDIKVNSKTLESLTILNAWFLQWLQWKVTSCRHVKIVVFAWHDFFVTRKIYDWMLPSLPLRDKNQSGTTLSKLRTHPKVKWSFSSVLVYIQ